MATHTEQVNLRLTVEERQLLGEVASHYGMGLTAVVRHLVRREGKHLRLFEKCFGSVAKSARKGRGNGS